MKINWKDFLATIILGPLLIIILIGTIVSFLNLFAGNFLISLQTFVVTAVFILISEAIASLIYPEESAYYYRYYR